MLTPSSSLLSTQTSFSNYDSHMWKSLLLPTATVSSGECHPHGYIGSRKKKKIIGHPLVLLIFWLPASELCGIHLFFVIPTHNFCCCNLECSLSSYLCEFHPCLKIQLRLISFLNFPFFVTSVYLFFLCWNFQRNVYTLVWHTSMLPYCTRLMRVYIDSNILQPTLWAP